MGEHGRRLTMGSGVALGAILTVFATAVPQQAAAYTCNAPLDVSDVQVTSVGPTPVSASGCIGPISGNDNELLASLNNGLLLGSDDAPLEDDWAIFGSKVDVPDNGSHTASANGVSVFVDDNGTLRWSVDFAPDLYSTFAISLKGGSNFGVYLFDFSPEAYAAYGGTYSMSGILNGGGQIPDLSHISIAVFGDPSVVPLPAAAWLLLAAAGGLGVAGVVKRRTA